MCAVQRIETKYRRIISQIPHPESLHLIEELAEIEPLSMSGFSPVVWDRAEGFQVWDAYGNMWIDFTSAVEAAPQRTASRKASSRPGSSKPVGSGSATFSITLAPGSISQIT